MLGSSKTRRLDEPIGVSLEVLVPTGHFYRHLEAKLDLGFVCEKVRDCHAMEAYQQAIRKCPVWVKPLLAEAKGQHDRWRLRLRGFINANIQELLITAGQNLKHFVFSTGWGRRYTPRGSLAALRRRRQGLSAVPS